MVFPDYRRDFGSLDSSQKLQIFQVFGRNPFQSRAYLGGRLLRGLLAGGFQAVLHEVLRGACGSELPAATRTALRNSRRRAIPRISTQGSKVPLYIYEREGNVLERLFTMLHYKTTFESASNVTEDLLSTTSTLIDIQSGFPSFATLMNRCGRSYGPQPASGVGVGWEACGALQSPDADNSSVGSSTARRLNPVLFRFADRPSLGPRCYPRRTSLRISLPWARLRVKHCLRRQGQGGHCGRPRDCSHHLRLKAIPPSGRERPCRRRGRPGAGRRPLKWCSSMEATLQGGATGGLQGGLLGVGARFWGASPHDAESRLIPKYIHPEQ